MREGLTEPPAKRPLVSIGLPTYGRSRLLQRALRSILDQTYTDIEVIVADDASPDDTERVCREIAAQDPRVRYVRHAQNIGPEPNFMYVLEEARGKYFMWLSDDDAFAPTFIEKAVRVLEDDPGVAACFCDYHLVDEHEQIWGAWHHDYLYPGTDWSQGRLDFFAYPYTRSSTVTAGLFRTSVLRKVRRPMSNTFLHLMSGHEAPLLAQVAARGRIVVLPELLFYAMGHHQTKDSLTHKVSVSLRFHELVLLQATLHAKLVFIALTAPLPLRDRARLAGASLGAFARHAKTVIAKRLGQSRRGRRSTTEAE